MLAQLPVEILLQITAYLDNETLTNLYELSRRLYCVIAPQLREIYRVKTVDLGSVKNVQEINIRPHLTGRRMLKFVEELIFVGHCGDHREWNHCFLHAGKCADDLGRALMPLFRGLKRHSLMTFRWYIEACVPHQILGSKGYLRRHQRNIKHLMLKTGWCIEDTDLSRKLSISRFHNVRNLCWTGISTINHHIALTHFFAANACRLEELTLDVYSHPRFTAKWRDLHNDWMKARNIFAFKVLQLQKNNTQSLFPRLRKLSLCGVGFQYAHTEMAYAFQLHKLHTLKLNSSHILETVAEIADNQTIPLTALIIRVDEQWSRLQQRFFALSMPNLKDVFLRINAPDQTSLTPHLRSIFTPGREIRRFVYHRHLYVASDTASVWDPTVGPMVWDTGVVTLLSKANLQCVGLCDHLPSLRFHLAQNPPMTWEILHIRCLPTIHEEYHPHNPTFDLTYDFDGPFNKPPTSVVDLTSYRSEFTTGEITEFLAFANWAFGPNGLPKLELLVFGQVNTTHWVQALERYIFLTRNTDVATRMKYPYRQVEVGDEGIQTKFEDNLDFLMTR
ncbi:hypothetical protein CNMCM6936_002277 [Aspergillus lentulus]|nr:hypothetical protein CNMCM6069_002579 [Aspergillus lentulus]KAF4162339.1 hypothetical protein CNMCM6936_002277 [Aspergillus lentulus]